MGLWELAPHIAVLYSKCEHKTYTPSCRDTAQQKELKSYEARQSLRCTSVDAAGPGTAGSLQFALDIYKSAAGYLPPVPPKPNYLTRLS